MESGVAAVTPTWHYVRLVLSVKLMKQVMSITLIIFTSSAELGTDKDYRKAVHWLETLRIRRIKTLEGGYNVSRTLCCRPDSMNAILQSLQRFVFEGTELIKNVLVKYADTLMSVPTGLAVAFHESLTHSTERRILRRPI